MMKKLMFSGLAFLSALAFYAQPVFADSVSETPTSVDTNPTVESSTSTDASITLNGGSITLLQAPSLTFGTHEISAKTQDITINSTSKDSGLTKSIAVQNGGQASGWHVTMKVGQFADNSDSSKVLKGATLKLAQLKVSTDSSLSAAPSGIAGADGTALATAGGDAITVFSAAQDTTNPVGVGLWRSYLASATLHIPAGNVTGNYTSKLTWTLSNTPQ